jgi:hypothetical protein
MSKAALIEFWRDLILSDNALELFKQDRTAAAARPHFTDAERTMLATDDFAGLYRAGVPVELLFQGILLAEMNPLAYM